MSQSEQPNRLTVMRSLTRKKGEEYEKLIFGAEVSLPSGLTLLEGFRDLDQTVRAALREAAGQGQPVFQPTTTPGPLELADVS